MSAAAQGCLAISGRIGCWLTNGGRSLVRMRLALVSRSTYTWARDDLLSGGDDRDLLPAWLWREAAG